MSFQIRELKNAVAHADHASVLPLAAMMTSRTSRRWTLFAVLAVLIAHFALAILSVRHKSPTFDETAHMTAGYAFWRFNDYRLQPENGNLPQRLAALPLVIAGAAFPDRNQDAWRRSNVWISATSSFTNRATISIRCCCAAGP